MAKSSPAWKRKKTSSFSDMEIDVARQLMQLCQQYYEDKRVTEETDENKPRRESLKKLDHPLEDEEEEEEHLQPRKRRFKSIDFLYSSTRPLIFQTVKKMKV
ncbi:hypothetical protein PTKIN_Ptkin09bG0242800 [Pterospermum kingtungense]